MRAKHFIVLVVMYLK